MRLQAFFRAALGVITLLFPAIWLGACSSPRADQSREPTLEIARQPYTAAELARAHPVDTYTLYRIRAQGQPVMLKRTLWTRSDEQGCGMENFDWAEDAPQEVVQHSGSATWTELKDHASFPAALTDISSDSIQVEAGKFECWLYRFEEPASPGAEGAPEPGPAALNLFWFAKDSPGSPVRYQVHVGGETVFDMELIGTNRLPKS
jgi:hypothetical protein